MMSFLAGQVIVIFIIISTVSEVHCQEAAENNHTKEVLLSPSRQIEEQLLAEGTSTAMMSSVSVVLNTRPLSRFMYVTSVIVDQQTDAPNVPGSQEPYGHRKNTIVHEDGISSTEVATTLSIPSITSSKVFSKDLPETEHSPSQFDSNDMTTISNTRTMERVSAVLDVNSPGKPSIKLTQFTSTVLISKPTTQTISTNSSYAKQIHVLSENIDNIPDTTTSTRNLTQVFFYTEIRLTSDSLNVVESIHSAITTKKVDKSVSMLEPSPPLVSKVTGNETGSTISENHFRVNGSTPVDQTYGVGTRHASKSLTILKPSPSVSSKVVEHKTEITVSGVNYHINESTTMAQRLTAEIYLASKSAIMLKSSPSVVSKEMKNTTRVANNTNETIPFPKYETVVKPSPSVRNIYTESADHKNRSLMGGISLEISKIKIKPSSSTMIGNIQHEVISESNPMPFNFTSHQRIDRLTAEASKTLRTGFSTKTQHGAMPTVKLDTVFLPTHTMQFLNKSAIYDNSKQSINKSFSVSSRSTANMTQTEITKSTVKPIPATQRLENNALTASVKQVINKSFLAGNKTSAVVNMTQTVISWLKSLTTTTPAIRHLGNATVNAAINKALFASNESSAAVDMTQIKSPWLRSINITKPFPTVQRDRNSTVRATMIKIMNGTLFSSGKSELSKNRTGLANNTNETIPFPKYETVVKPSTSVRNMYTETADHKNQSLMGEIPLETSKIKIKPSSSTMIGNIQHEVISESNPMPFNFTSHQRIDRLIAEASKTLLTGFSTKTQHGAMPTVKLDTVFLPTHTMQFLNKSATYDNSKQSINKSFSVNSRSTANMTQTEITKSTVKPIPATQRLENNALTASVKQVINKTFLAGNKTNAVVNMTQTVISWLKSLTTTTPAIRHLGNATVNAAINKPLFASNESSVAVDMTQIKSPWLRSINITKPFPTIQHDRNSTVRATVIKVMNGTLFSSGKSELSRTLTVILTQVIHTESISISGTHTAVKPTSAIKNLKNVTIFGIGSLDINKFSLSSSKHETAAPNMSSTTETLQKKMNATMLSSTHLFETPTFVYNESQSTQTSHQFGSRTTDMNVTLLPNSSPRLLSTYPISITKTKQPENRFSTISLISRSTMNMTAFSSASFRLMPTSSSNVLKTTPAETSYYIRKNSDSAFSPVIERTISLGSEKAHVPTTVQVDPSYPDISTTGASTARGPVSMASSQRNITGFKTTIGVGLTKQLKDTSKKQMFTETTTTTPFTVATTPKSGVLHQEFRVTIKITSEPYTNKLSRRSSKEFREKSRAIEQQFDRIYKDIPEYSYVKVLRFFKGSLGCEVEVILESKEKSPVSKEKIEAPLLKAKKSGSFGDYVLGDVDVVEKKPEAQALETEDGDWGTLSVITVSILSGVCLVLLVIVITQYIQKRHYSHSLTESSAVAEYSPAIQITRSGEGYDEYHANDEERVPMTTFNGTTDV